jgi:hypothetical protein
VVVQELTLAIGDDHDCEEMESRMSMVEKVARAIIDQLKADALRLKSFDTLEHEIDEDELKGTYDGRIDAVALAHAAI